MCLFPFTAILFLFFLAVVSILLFPLTHTTPCEAAAPFIDPSLPFTLWQWHLDADDATASPEALLSKATALLANGEPTAAADLAAACRIRNTHEPHRAQRALERALLEVESRAAAAAGDAPRALATALERAALDRGYETVGRRLAADALLRADRTEEALSAFMLCVDGQRCSPHLWRSLADCYLALPPALARPKHRHFAILALLRARAWTGVALHGSTGFAREPQAALCRELEEALAALSVASVTVGESSHTELEHEDVSSSDSLQALVDVEHAALAALGETIL